MLEPLSDSMKKITRGTAIAMAGMSFGLLLQFIARLIIARYALETNYGIFSLALIILTFAMMVASLGLNQGATRCIAYFRATGEAAKVRSAISGSLQMATAASVVIGVALFFSADAIALNIFHTPDLAPALRIFSIGVPFFTLINVLVAIYRGFDRVEPQVYFQFILLDVLFPLLLAIPVFLKLPFVSVFYVYLATLVLTFIALSIYIMRESPPLAFAGGKADISITKELLLFSLPLFGTGIFALVLTWIDSLMLGYFKTPDVVGLYSAAYPSAQFIAQPLTALALIYVPVATALYSRNLMAELRRNYAVVTKWLVFLSLPIFLVLCLFPEVTLKLLFGSEYVAAAPALRILSFGFLLNNIFGPNGPMLIATGRTMFLFWLGLAAAALNVVLNIILIPPLGIVGAAVATLITIAMTNTVAVARLYSSYRVQPLSKNLLKPLVLSVALAFLFQLIINNFITVTWWMLPLLFILYYAIYGVATVLTRSFDKEDIALLIQIEKRSGMNAAPIKKILARFL
jgi:O-antigen/teichoic acid export membrane protein